MPATKSSLMPATKPAPKLVDDSLEAIGQATVGDQHVAPQGFPIQAGGTLPVPANLPRVPHVLLAMLNVMKGLGEIGGITKGHDNKEQHYKFRGIDDVYNTLNGLLTTNDLLILPTVVGAEFRDRKTSTGKPVSATFLTVDLTFVSARDGSERAVRVVGEGADMSDKGTNKAMSAAYKYACIQVFCIPTDGISEDADADTIEMRGYDKVDTPPAEPPSLAAPPPLTKAQARTVFDRLSKENRALANIEDFNGHWAHPDVQHEAKSLPADWMKILKAEKEDKAAELAEREQRRGDDTPPNDDDNIPNGD